MSEPSVEDIVARWERWRANEPQISRWAREVDALIASWRERGELLPCGHHRSLEIKSVESDYRSCELCEARHMQRDAEAMEIHHRNERDVLRKEIADLRAALKDKP